MERHLRLVASNTIECNKKTNLKKQFIDKFDEIKSMFISETEKIYILKDILTKLYKDYEETTGIIDEPYFIRAEKKVRRIIREKKVDHYYKLLKKFRQERFYY